MDNSPPGLTAATTADVVAIVALMNLAFRGGGSDAGWTTEADHFEGNRTSEALLREDITANSDGAMLLWRPPDGARTASHGSNRIGIILLLIWSCMKGPSGSVQWRRLTAPRPLCPECNPRRVPS
jgi:hypothetical protein